MTRNPALASSEASRPVPVPTSMAVVAGWGAHGCCTHGGDKIGSSGPGGTGSPGPGGGNTGGAGSPGGVGRGSGACRPVWRSRSTAFRYTRVMERASTRSYTGAIIVNRRWARIARFLRSVGFCEFLEGKPSLPSWPLSSRLT